MKKLIVAGVIFLLVFQTKAQDSTRRFKQVIYKATVYGINNVISANYLVQVNDSVIALSSKPHPYGLPVENAGSLNLVSHSDIEQIQVRRKGAAGRGIIAGLFAGAALGAIIGFASGDDKAGSFQIFHLTAGEKAMGLGIMGGLLGGIAGGIMGAVATKKFYINRSPSALKKMNTSLLERVYAR